MRRLFLPLAFLFSQFSFAQQVRPANSAQIYNEIARLKNLTNVLYFAAHPDDENTRLLAWLANDQHIRTAYLSLTRGDGGQNILGTEQGAALGLIRTHELIEARKLDGAEQFFTRAIDFGFSKTHQETFKHWNEDQLVSDAVWVIRKFRPDVIICRFPPNEQAGHGQHAASAIIAEKAFHAAGDPTKYPDQLKYYGAWQPKRIVFNSFRFGDRNTITTDNIKVPVGQYSPLIGMGYGELAGISRSIHKSQGAGTPSTPGVQTEYFKHVAGEPMTNSLFDGIDISWKRVKNPEIDRQID
ncbi:MAG: family deacetylase, partial [Flavipsychrobacter sp.]|nr:family deacetylase [Flavipsychrobacter sp.]